MPTDSGVWEGFLIMAIRVNKRNKTIMDKIPTIVKSEFKFRNLVLAGVMAGLLSVSEPGKKQHHFHRRPAKFEQNGDIGYEQYWHLDREDGLFVPRLTTLFSNSSATAAKLTFINNVQIAHAPLKELNESSQRTAKMRTALDVTKMLQLREYGDATLHAAMATFTIPNCNKGGLNDAVSEMSKLISKLLKALKDGTNNHNGLQLYDYNGNPVPFIGGLMTIEITINQVKLHDMDSNGLFHPHVHLVLLTLDDIDEDDARDRLFNYWQTLNSNYVLSPKAFGLEHAYSDSSDAADDAAIVAEATKYAAKPGIYKVLPTIKNTNTMKQYDQFALETFCELFKCIKGRQLKRSYGLLLDAIGFINWVNNGVSVPYTGKNPMHPDNEKVSILSALTAGKFNDDGVKIHVPDIMTKLYTIKPTGGYQAQSLSDDELVYANSLLLEGATWQMPDNIKWPKGPKADTYRWLLEHFTFVQPGIGGLVGQTEEWLKSLDRRLNYVQTHVFDPDERLDKTIKLRRQVDDVRRLLNVLKIAESIDGSDATVITTHDYHSLYREISLMQLMDAHHAQLTRDSNGKIDGVKFDDPSVEKKLVQTYSHKQDPYHFWGGYSSFLPISILHEYNFWQHRTLDEFKADLLQHTPTKDINLVSKMDSKTMQKWINKSLKPKAKPGLNFHQMFAAGSPQNPSLTDDKLDELCNLFDDGTCDNDDDDNTEINSISDVFPDLKW